MAEWAYCKLIQLIHIKRGVDLIKLTSMDNRTIVVNINLIEKIESMPETVISLTTGKKIIVLEGVDEVIGRAIEYQSMVMKNSLTPAHRGELYE